MNSGIRPGHVLTFRMRLPTYNLYQNDRAQAAFYRRVLDNVERIPGIQSAGLSDVLPLGQQNHREYFTIEKRPLPPGQSLVADFRRIATAPRISTALLAVFAGISMLVAAWLLTVALIANYIPARRATRIDPMEALHNE